MAPLREKKYFFLNSQQRYQPTSSTLVLTGIPTDPEMHHYHKHHLHLVTHHVFMFLWLYSYYQKQNKTKKQNHTEYWVVLLKLFYLERNFRLVQKSPETVLTITPFLKFLLRVWEFKSGSCGGIAVLQCFVVFFSHPHTSNLTKHSQTAHRHLKERQWLRTIRNKEKTFLHKPPARLFSGSTFDQWRLDGLGTGPITSKWNIEFPFCKDQPPFTGGGIFKCRPACQVVYILLLEKSQSPEAMHNGYTMTSKQR